MAMAMVQKARPLVEMKEKPTTASPDYDTFQLLFRKADEILSSSNISPSYDLCANLNDTEGLIEGESTKKPFTNGSNELVLFHTVSSRKILPPKSYTDEIRTIRVKRHKRSRDYNLGYLPISPYDAWENGIVWNDDWLNMISRGKGGWVYQHHEDENTVSKKLRKVISCQNSEILSGRWVNGILWDSDTTYTIELYDHSDSEGESLQAKRKRSTSDADEYEYSENISLVNTAEMLDVYLPHHQEGIRKLQLKKKQDDERRRLSVHLPSAAPAPAPQSLANIPDAHIKGSMQRQQQAREKNFKTPTANTVGALVSSSIEDSISNQAAAIRKKKLNALTELEHSTPATRHLTCKVSLKTSELKYYRRPLGRGLQQVWNISFDSKKNRNKVSHKRGQIRQQLVNQIRTFSDLSLLDGDYICVEYVEEHPNALMNPGMASKIINYYRQLPDEKNQASSTEESLSSEGQALSTGIPNNSKRLPRHLLHLQHNSESSTTSSVLDTLEIPKLSEGVTEVLESGDPFPFMGDIEPGAPPQPCFHSNLFRAPLFNQSARPTDFLLIRNHQNLFFTCGQQEPLLIVPKPGKKKSLNIFQQNFLMLHMTRYFLTQGGSNVDPVVSFSDVQREFEYFFKRYRNDAKRCLSRVADELGDDWWKRKPLTAIVPVEEYETKFTPEEVCLQERSMCSEYQLQELGITQLLDITKMQQGIQRMNWLQKSRKKRLESVRESARLCSGTSKSIRLEKLADILEHHYKKLKNEIDVARFIYERMQLTPWVITESFVKGYLEKGGDGMLRLHGLGDPSGIGDGFSLLRNIKSSGKQNEVTIYNTDKDLRKISMKQLNDLLAPHYTSEEINELTRWQKVRRVASLANVAHDEGIAHDLHRFARSKKPSLQNQLSDFREACQRIWRRQASALSIQWKDIQSSVEDDEELDGDDDFDDEFSDLEDDVAPTSSTAPGIVPGASGSSSGSGNTKGRKKEEEDNKELKSLKTGEFFDSLKPNHGSLPVTTPQVQPSEFVVSQGIQWVPPKQVVKRITRKIKLDGSETIEVRFIVSDVEVSRVLSKNGGNQTSAKKKTVNQKHMIENEDLFEDEKSDAHSLRLNIGKMKTKVQKHARESAQLKALQELEEQRELDRYNMPIRSAKDRGNANRGKVTRNSRLPHVLFASTLEQIIVGIMKRKNAIPFLHPVDTNAFPDYLLIVQRPICLFDIRDNIAKYKYSTVDMFLEDLQLMVKNCEQYNGANSYYSKEASQIYNETLELINVDRDILGHDKDPYTIQQNDIRTKFQQLKRPINSTMIPDLMLTSTSTFIPTPEPTVSSSSFLVDEGFGQFLDAKEEFDDGFDLKLDENEEIPPPSTTSKTSRSDDNTPVLQSQPSQNTPQFDEDFGSSSGEEEVLEVGTF